MRGLKSVWVRFAAAMQFLTVLPVDPGVAVDGRILASSMSFFPAVGLVIGVMQLLAFLGLSYLFPPLATAAILALVPVAITGGIHLDGLADTSDGVFSGRGRERMLEIMKDSRVGTFGVIAIVAHLLLGVSALASIIQTLEAGDLGALLESGTLFLVLPPVAARVSPVIAALHCPYARVGEGLGKPYTEHVTWVEATMAPVLALVVCAGIGLWTGRMDLALAIPIGTWVTAFLANAYVMRKLGGVTGDTFGALLCLGELGGLLTALAMGVF